MFSIPSIISLFFSHDRPENKNANNLTFKMNFKKLFRAIALWRMFEDLDV